MTEREFNQKVEDMAVRFERRVETAADYLDKGITRKYDKRDKGYRTAAMWCAGLGIAGLAAELLRILVFRRKR